jgi:hypothetical protein
MSKYMNTRKEVIEPKPNGSGQAAKTNQPRSGGPTIQQICADFLSRREVAARWSCCPRTVERRTDLKPVRFNKRFLRYRLSDVEAIERAATV